MDEPSTGLKAIDTYFNGHYFRSRLEARWAMFFKTLSIPYMYEAEGFELGDIRYLPDFWLPNQDCFFEVKGPFTNNDGFKKAVRLSDASGKMVYIFGDIPEITDNEGMKVQHEGEAFFPKVGYDFGYMWCRKPCCGKLGIQFNGRSARIPCECPDRSLGDKGYTYAHFQLRMAYTAARHYRF